MHLSKVLSSLTFVTVALAAVVGASTSGDPAEIKRHHVSRFDEEIPLPPVNPNEVNSKALNRIRGRLIQWRHDLNDIYTNFAHSSLSEDVAEDGEWVMQQHFHHMDLMVWAASKKTLSLFQDMCRCFEKALKAANGIGIGGNDTIAIDCIRETLLGRDDRSEPAVQNAPEVAKREEIVTAPPAGTTTVYKTVPAATVIAGAFPDRPDELLATHIGGTYGVLTTDITETMFTTTTPGVPLASVTTLTDPINPTVTSVRTLGSTASSVNNTSIDTHSYIDISTFSATGTPTYATSTSLSVDSSLMSQMSSEMSSVMSSGLASKTVTLANGATTTEMGPLPSGTSTVGSHSAKTIDDSGTTTFLLMLAGAVVCFIFAWFL